jgi:predicted methyltransferase
MLERIRFASAALVFTAAMVCRALAQQDADSRARGEERREAWQKVPQILEALAVRPGASVADVGAGGGFFTVRLSRAVGPQGRVYAVDVGVEISEKLRERVKTDGLTNVEVIQSTVDDPKLPAGALDAALIVNSYHEMTEHQAMLARIKSALKPTGRLVIIEPISESRRDETRERQTDSHEIGAQYVQEDARRAGFRVVRLEDPFTTRQEGSNRDEEWLLVLAPAPDRAAAPAGDDRDRAKADAEWKSPELRISVEAFKALYETDAVLVLDVRDPGSYRRGHLPGAILMTGEELHKEGAARLRGETRPIVTYCS